MFTNSNHFKLGSIMFCIMIYFMTVGILVTKKLKIIIFYLVFFSATMSHVQRVENSTCTEYFFYIYCRLFINIFVSLSPVILVVTIFALLCCCEIVKGCLTHDSD